MSVDLPMRVRATYRWWLRTRSGGKWIGRGEPAVVSPTCAPPRTLRAVGSSTFAPLRATSGVSSCAPGGCQRLATSRTPSTLRLPNRPGPCRLHPRRLRERGPHLAALEARARRMVVVAVGGSHRSQQFRCALPLRARRQDREHLHLALEGDARDLLLDQQRVVDAPARLPEAVPDPAQGREPERDAGSERDRLPALARLPPLVALERGGACDEEERQGHPIVGVTSHVARLGVVVGLLHGLAVRPLL